MSERGAVNTSEAGGPQRCTLACVCVSLLQQGGGAEAAPAASVSLPACQSGATWEPRAAVTEELLLSISGATHPPPTPYNLLIDFSIFNENTHSYTQGKRNPTFPPSLPPLKQDLQQMKCTHKCERTTRVNTCNSLQA